MKFIRHFLAASAVVALVVALGFAWSRSPAAGLVADGRGGRFEQKGAHGISLSNAGDLVQTLVAVGAIVGGVIWVDKARRRRNPRVPAMRSPAT